jgi:hypothetical protein
MADAIGPANISHNLASELEYFLPVSAGIGGEPLRQKRAPGVILRSQFQGLSQTLVIPKSLFNTIVPQATVKFTMVGVPD